VSIQSGEIARAELRVSRPLWTHLYAAPFVPFYPLLAYAYYVKYDDWLRSEEWTFLSCVLLGASHALAFLSTRWSAAARARITTSKVRTLVGARVYVVDVKSRRTRSRTRIVSKLCRTCTAVKARLSRS
jgi:cation-transporting ATPase 13A1